MWYITGAEFWIWPFYVRVLEKEIFVQQNCTGNSKEGQGRCSILKILRKLSSILRLMSCLLNMTVIFHCSYVSQGRFINRKAYEI